jgi:hypothetical protein
VLFIVPGSLSVKRMQLQTLILFKLEDLRHIGSFDNLESDESVLYSRPALNESISK